eukprot:UN09062
MYIYLCLNELPMLFGALICFTIKMGYGHFVHYTHFLIIFQLSSFPLF